MCEVTINAVRGVAMPLLKQDVAHMRKIKEHEAYQAKLEGVLGLAKRVLVDGDEAERVQVAQQIEMVLGGGA